MIIIVIYIIFSFLLDNIVSLYTNINIANPSYFRTIFSLIAIVISYSYFDEDKKYLYILFILGAFFDIVYTNTLLLNVFIFLIIYIITKILNNYIPNNWFTINIKTIIAIIIYHTLSYLMLILVNYGEYPIKLLLIIISRSLIMTIIYSTISYFIIRKIYFLKYDKKIK